MLNFLQIVILLSALILVSCSTGNRMPEYNRSEWGTSWRVKNCLSVRENVLISNATDGLKLSKSGCEVLDGVWIDFYTGERISMADSPEIDHVVPVEHVHSIGGHRWSKEKRSKFYQDKDNLVITSKAMNSSKGSKSFVDWHPLSHDLSCRYASKWISVKIKYNLPFSKSECFNIEALEKSKPCSVPLKKIKSC